MAPQLHLKWTVPICCLTAAPQVYLIFFKPMFSAAAKGFCFPSAETGKYANPRRQIFFNDGISGTLLMKGVP